MRRAVVIAAALLVGASASANMILNGDFEANSAPFGPQFNLSNPQFTATVADATAFGGANELDLTETGDNWGVDPQNGKGGSSRPEPHDVRRVLVDPIDSDRFWAELSARFLFGQIW